MTKPHRLVGLLILWSAASCGDEADGSPEPTVPSCSTEPIPTRAFETSEEDAFVAGPMLMHTTGTTTVIVWETATSCSGVARYGAYGEALTYSVDAEVDGLIHKARLQGLVEDRRYQYRVEACGVTSEVHSFFTAPPAGAPIRFTVAGDTQSYPERARATMEAMAAEAPYLLLHVGDVVGNGDEEAQWRDEFLTPLRALGPYVPTYVAIGNHERNASSFYAYTDYPRDAALAETDTFGSNYSFTYGNVFFLILDTNNLQFVLAFLGESDLSEWIEEQLASDAAQSATWRIVAGHHPGFTQSWSPGNCEGFTGMESVVAWLMPLMAEHGFQLYLSGHTHGYERGEDNGVTHVITGGGGGPLDEWCRDLPQVEVAELRHHYLTLEAGCEQLTLQAHAVPEEAEPFDAVVIEP